MPPPPMPLDRLERVDSWGGNIQTVGYVYRPATVDAIRETLALARNRGLTVGLRGAGRSYGDASLNREEITLTLERMNRILAWNPETGVLTVEGGVAIAQVWRHVLGDGWWPPVVSGTMFPTVAGALAVNIHGKNHVRAGTLGENVLAFDLLRPDGSLVTLSPCGPTAALFHAVIGGLGVLGVIVSATLQMKRVYSGLVRVQSHAVANWDDLFARFDATDADYAVGWVDGFAHGKSAGRGLIERAYHLSAGDDPRAAQTLRVESQDLGDTVLGVVPKSVLWRVAGPLLEPDRLRRLNGLQYAAGRLKSGATAFQTHAGYAFKLDYVPDWKRAYGAGGLVQYQTFIPRPHARRVFASLITRCQSAGLVPTLCVFKQHRPDPFLLSYSGDGYSLALDFKRTTENASALARLLSQMDGDVTAAGGRFYFAKDSHLHPARLGAFLASPAVQTFRAWKRELDPDGLLQTDLYRRIFGD